VVTKTEPPSRRGRIPLARGIVLLISTSIGGSMVGALSDASGTSARRPHQASADLSPIVELRQYTLRPNHRDAFIDLFDRNFVESQEAVGMTIIGQFRDLDEPNRFVWLRGFPDMAARTRSLTEFYDGTLWKSLRDSANASIIDNDNVLLLRPAHPGSGFVIEPSSRQAPVAGGAGKGLVIATVYHIDAGKEAEFVDFFNAKVAPVLASAGAEVIAEFVPEQGVNTFPRLPVREGEHVFVWFARFASAATYERFKVALSESGPWRETISAELTSRIREPQVLRLSPTARSLLHD
jgi:hypothetical protein